MRDSYYSSKGGYLFYPPSPIDLTREYKFYDKVGKCEACHCSVELAPPRAGKLAISYDNRFLVRCTNPNCHYNMGWEVWIEDIGIVPFVIFDEKLLVKQNELELPEGVIDFQKMKNKRKNPK